MGWPKWTAIAVALAVPLADAVIFRVDRAIRVVIVPSQRLVVVRLGDSVDRTGDIRGLGSRK